MHFFGMTTVDEVPSCSVIPEDIWLKPNDELQDILLSVAKIIVDEMVDLSLTFKMTKEFLGHILEYSGDVILLGLLYMHYRDSINKGDGLRVILSWKYMPLLFKATNRRNYAIEAVQTLANNKITTA